MKIERFTIKNDSYEEGDGWDSPFLEGAKSFEGLLQEYSLNPTTPIYAIMQVGVAYKKVLYSNMEEVEAAIAKEKAEKDSKKDKKTKVATK